MKYQSTLYPVQWAFNPERAMPTPQDFKLLRAQNPEEGIVNLSPITRACLGRGNQEGLTINRSQQLDELSKTNCQRQNTPDFQKCLAQNHSLTL